MLAAFAFSLAFARSGAVTLTQAKEAELKAANAIKSAPDVAAKLAAAEALVKKYPKSTLRLEVVKYVGAEIEGVTDPAQRVTLAEQFQKVFTEENELAVSQPIAIDAYIAAKRFDDAFTLGATVLGKQPDSVGVLTVLAIAGTEEAKRQNPKFVPQSQQYGLKAIELMEANKKPATMDDAYWSRWTAMLPQLHQEMGVLALLNSNAAEAKARLEKAIALKPNDPLSYFFLGGIYNDEYQQMAEKYRAMPEGKDKAATLTKATELMDKVIDNWARAIANADGKPEFKQLHDQVLQDLTPYYKYRHNQSTDGMQQLIDKYKAPAKP